MRLRFGTLAADRVSSGTPELTQLAIDFGKRRSMSPFPGGQAFAFWICSASLVTRYLRLIPRACFTEGITYFCQYAWKLAPDWLSPRTSSVSAAAGTAHAASPTARTRVRPRSLQLPVLRQTRIVFLLVGRWRTRTRPSVTQTLRIAHRPLSRGSGA